MRDLSYTLLLQIFLQLSQWLQAAPGLRQALKAVSDLILSLPIGASPNFSAPKRVARSLRSNQATAHDAEDSALAVESRESWAHQTTVYATKACQTRSHARGPRRNHKETSPITRKAGFLQIL